MPYTFNAHPQQERFDAFVKAQPAGHLLQSYAWPQMKAPLWQGRHFTVEENGQIVAAATVLVRSLLLGRTFWYLPEGPVLDFERPDLLQFFLDALIREAQHARAAIFKIEPGYARRVYRYGETSLPSYVDTAKVEKAFALAGFRHLPYSLNMDSTIQPRFDMVTFQDSVAEGFPPHVGRFLKDAAKQHVVVTKEGPEALDDFAYLIRLTEAEKGVGLRDKAYFARLFEVYGDQVQLYLARIPLKEAAEDAARRLAEAQRKLAALPENAPKKRQAVELQVAAYERQKNYYEERRAEDGDTAVLAGCLSVLYGRRCEMLYAGMNRAYSKITAQFPVYVDTMQEAFARGAELASMGGVEGTLDDGLSKFKANFAPHVVEKIGAFDFVFSHSLYWAYNTLVPLLLHRSKRKKEKTGEKGQDLSPAKEKKNAETARP